MLHQLLISISNRKWNPFELWFLATMVLISTAMLVSGQKMYRSSQNIGMTVVKEVPIIVVPTVIPIVTPTIIYEKVIVVPTASAIKIKQTKILIVGDSMVVEGFGPQFAQDLSVNMNFEVVRKGKYSTGLNRVDAYDWYQNSVDLINQYKPDALIVMFGANDSQNILDNQGKPYIKSDPKWDEIYTKRVTDYMALISPMIKKIYWVGQPMARDPGFSTRLKNLNRIYQAEATKWSNIQFISTWERFTLEGKYVAMVADDDGLVKRVKADDGIHLTIHGSKIMSQLVIKELRSNFAMK